MKRDILTIRDLSPEEILRPDRQSRKDEGGTCGEDPSEIA